MKQPAKSIFSAYNHLSEEDCSLTCPLDCGSLPGSERGTPDWLTFPYTVEAHVCVLLYQGPAVASDNLRAAANPEIAYVSFAGNALIPHRGETVLSWEMSCLKRII